MKLKIFFVALALAATTCVPIVASAQAMTAAQRQALILQLQQEIAQITVQINQLLLARQNCKPNWQCADWGLCISGQQARTCTDLNNCGVATGEPNLNQTCSQASGVKLQVNNSDGPLNIFVSIGNGASVSSSNITLSQTVSLKWQSVNAASCVASDTLTPTVFSGYQPASGSESLTFYGNIQNNSSSNNRVSDTFRINCISTINGGTISDSVTVNLFYTVNSSCNPYWNCTSWSSCSGSQQTRTCTDWNGCGSLAGQPIVKQSCSVIPTVTIKANNAYNSVTVASGSSVSLSWSSSGATSCVASGDWSGTKSTSGSETVSSITSSRAYNITCSNSGGASTNSVVVNVTGS